MTSIRETLEESIAALGDERFPSTPSGVKHRIYLNPETGQIYPFTHVGAGQPMAVFQGRHVTVCHVPLDAIPASVVNVLEQHIGLLERVCDEAGTDLSDPDDYADSAHNQLGQFEPEIACFWHPADWYEPCDREIRELMAQGHSAEQIADQIGLGDDFNGCVDPDAAAEWMAERMDEIRQEAVEAIADADDPDDQIEALTDAWRLHGLMGSVTDRPIQTLVAIARKHGHGNLADAILEHIDATDDELTERTCYGCGADLDPHAGLSVVYCGACGDR